MEKTAEIDAVVEAVQAGPSAGAFPSHNNISFRSVAPVDISIRGLVVTVDEAPDLLTSLRLRLQKKGPRDEEAVPNQKIILGNVSADLPRGSLTAILGGSGSGKTTL
jgi:ABC-type multidrug transport system fused ATPase/permease subunit